MKYVWVLLSIFAMSFTASADVGMKTKVSKYSYAETQTRLDLVLREKGLIVFAKIDHAEGAKQFDLKMPPATVTIFGHPKGGTPFMLVSPESAIDFPLKALVWEDASGKVFYSYNTLSYVVDRHRIKGQEELTKKLNGLLDVIATAATE